jgi:hypothetical protein
VVDRIYTNIAQLQVTAPDPATAQAAFEAGVAAARAAMAALTPPVTLEPEIENGQYVMEQP